MSRGLQVSKFTLCVKILKCHSLSDHQRLAMVGAAKKMSRLIAMHWAEMQTMTPCTWGHNCHPYKWTLSWSSQSVSGLPYRSVSESTLQLWWISHYTDMHSNFNCMDIGHPRLETWIIYLVVSFSIVHKCCPIRRESMAAWDVALIFGCFEFLRIHNLSVRSYLRMKFSSYNVQAPIGTCSDMLHWVALNCFKLVEALL